MSNEKIRKIEGNLETLAGRVRFLIDSRNLTVMLISMQK